MEGDWIAIQSGLTVGLRMAVEHLNMMHDIFCRHPNNSTLKSELCRAADGLMRDVFDLKVDLLMIQNIVVAVFKKQNILRSQKRKS